MLLELKVNQFAIIDNVHISFKKGLNILSGETGAGKSVLVKSLGLLMGLKGSVETIRSGSQQASVEGVFDLKFRPDLIAKLEEWAIPTDDHLLIVKRVITPDRSRVYLNGTLSPLQQLRDLVAPLVEVAGAHAPLIELTGQHDTRHLFSKSFHLELLDFYAGLNGEKAKYYQDYSQLLALDEQITSLQKDPASQAQRLDFIKYQLTEIEGLNLKENEDTLLEAQIQRQKGQTRLLQFFQDAENGISQAESAVEAVINKSREVCKNDLALQAEIEKLTTIQSQLSDWLYDFQKTNSFEELDESELEALQDRLSRIRKLQRKFGPDVDSILKQLQSLQEEARVLESVDKELARLQKDRKALVKKLEDQASHLHQKRLGAAKTLANSVNQELLDLNMKGVQFAVGLELSENLGPSGKTDSEFLAQTTTREPPRPLAKTASGGELSRILLSLKKVIGSSDQPRTYLFDEVDTGVSGPTAEKVGRKLKEISVGQQVICVTHLPQVAAFGDAHFSIQKSVNKKSSVMEISELKKEDRIQEIARLISGETISKTSLAHAEQLLREART